MMDKCRGCFGAANNDCDECQTGGKKNDTKKIQRRNAERQKSDVDTRYKKRRRSGDRKRRDGHDYGGCERERADN